MCLFRVDIVLFFFNLKGLGTGKMSFGAGVENGSYAFPLCFLFEIEKKKLLRLSALTVLRLRCGRRGEGEVSRAARAGRRQPVLDVLVLLRAVHVVQVAAGPGRRRVVRRVRRRDVVEGGGRAGRAERRAQQAARVAGMSVRVMVATVRRLVGG